MTWRLGTILTLITTLVLLLAWDLVVAVMAGWENTISFVVWDLVQRAPILAFLLGLIVGHLIWPHQSDVKNLTDTQRIEAASATLDQASGEIRIAINEVERECT